MTKWSEHGTMPIPIQWKTVADLATPAHNLENIFYQQIFLPTDPRHKQLQNCVRVVGPAMPSLDIS